MLDDTRRKKGVLMMKSNQCLIALALGLGLALGLPWLLGSQNSVALADPGILYVAPGGDCGGAAPCYATIQAAVDAASAGDEIRVGEGIYTSVQNVPSLNTATFTATQAVVITKTITIQGGYTTSDWDTPDPAANPTTLDAQGQGRVLVITDTVNVTVEGLRITGGNATGLGGSPWGDDAAGAGVYVYWATATISSCMVYSNTASTTSGGWGGGLYFYGGTAMLSGNTVEGNTASTADWGIGGGMCLYYSPATLGANTFQGNTAGTGDEGYGGGLYLAGHAPTLSSNIVQGNTANIAGFGRGGGLYVIDSAATLSGNMVQGNTASIAASGEGGGLCLHRSAAMLSGNMVLGNTASTAGSGDGGGLYLDSSDAIASGNTVQGNTASTASGGYGGGLYLRYSDATLSNNSVVSNTASTASYGRGGGLYLDNSAATLSGNVVQGNTVSTASNGWGGGLCLSSSDATLRGNRVQGNTASTALHGYGGGLEFASSDVTLSDNTIISNTATTAAWGAGYGGGLWVGYDSSFTLINNVVADNHANTKGSGLYVEASSSRLLHATIARNIGGDGSGVYVTDNGYGNYSTVALTNTIVVSHTMGVVVTESSTATLNATLWHANGTDTGGAGSISTLNDHDGDPAFAADGYHLTSSSTAIDAGVDAGVTTDIDGEARPQGTGYDIGADELRQRYVYLPLVLRGW
jgi:hypothetical protein